MRGTEKETRLARILLAALQHLKMTILNTFTDTYELYSITNCRICKRCLLICMYWRYICYIIWTKKYVYRF